MFLIENIGIEFVFFLLFEKRIWGNLGKVEFYMKFVIMIFFWCFDVDI